MARPKADLREQSARNRIAAAFWRLLADGPYADITIKRLASEAGVNHKTIYYHFDNVGDMARVLFLENAHSVDMGQVTSRVLHGRGLEELFDDPRTRTAIERSWLFARGDSAYLAGMFRECIADAWAEQAGADPADLREEEQAYIGFVMHGLTWLIGEAVRGGRTSDLPKLMGDPVWKGMRETLLRMSGGQ